MRNWLLPEKFEDILPPQAQRIDRMRAKLLELFRVHGYQLVIPPMLEYLESLLTGTGHDLDLRTFKLVDQLSGRMMGVRADQENVFNPNRGPGASTNRRGGLPRRRPPKIETDDGDALVPHCEHQRPRLQRVQQAVAGPIMPRAIAPHGKANRRRDIYPGGPCLKLGSAQSAGQAE